MLVSHYGLIALTWGAMLWRLPTERMMDDLEVPRSPLWAAATASAKAGILRLAHEDLLAL